MLCIFRIHITTTTHYQSLIVVYGLNLHLWNFQRVIISFKSLPNDPGSVLAIFPVEKQPVEICIVASAVPKRPFVPNRAVQSVVSVLIPVLSTEAEPAVISQRVSLK